MTTTDARHKLKAGEIDTAPPDYVVADAERHERIAVLFAAELARAERDADPEATYDRFVRIANGKAARCDQIGHAGLGTCVFCGGIAR